MQDTRIIKAQLGIKLSDATKIENRVEKMKETFSYLQRSQSSKLEIITDVFLTKLGVFF